MAPGVCLGYNAPGDRSNIIDHGQWTLRGSRSRLPRHSVRASDVLFPSRDFKERSQVK